MAAPTQPMPLDLEPPRAKWPTVWGWLMLVWAVLSVLGACCGVLSIVMAPMFGGMSGMDFPPAPREMTYWIVADCVITIFLVIALVMGGMALLRRRKSAAKICMMYVVVRLLLVPIGIVGGIMLEQPGAEWGRQINAAIVDSMQKGGQKPPPELLAAASNTKPAGYVRYQSVGLPLLLAIFPALLAYWITRPKSKEEMARWTA